jgi:hypothetical protein
VMMGACTNRPSRPLTPAPTPTSGEVSGRSRLGEPIALRNSSTILVPFVLETSKGLFEDDDPYTRGGVADAGRNQYRRAAASSVAPERSRSVRWHNVIAKDIATNEEWTILTRRGIIGSWDPDVLGDGSVLFIAVLDDTNRDGMLNNLDARVAIVTNKNARNPRIVTPANAQVWGASLLAGTQLVHFTIATDTNNDNRIDYRDESGPWTWEIGSTEMARPVVSAETLRKVEQMLGQ